MEGVIYQKRPQDNFLQKYTGILMFVNATSGNILICT